MMVLQENDLPRVVVSLDTLYVRHKKEIGIPPTLCQRSNICIKIQVDENIWKIANLDIFMAKLSKLTIFCVLEFWHKKKNLLFGKNYTFNIVWICVYC